MRSLVWLSFLVALVLPGCGGESTEAGGMTGTVSVDGSSTVFPITEAIAEEFRTVQPRVRVTVGISGTGGGFKKFCSGETDINDASRPIKVSEVEVAGTEGIEFIELPVAFDGISVLVNPGNDFVDHLTVEELNRIWQPGSKVEKWSDVRAEWPAREINLYGPGPDSGTFDYFTEAVNGESQRCRSDFTASEDDNVLVKGISGDADALGFFGFAYFVENQAKLKAVPIMTEAGPVAPSATTINDGTYRPLSRPIFIYVRNAAVARPEVRAFVDFYLEMAPSLVAEVGYVPLSEKVYSMARARFENNQVGSTFLGRTAGMEIEDLLAPQG